MPPAQMRLRLEFKKSSVKQLPTGKLFNGNWNRDNRKANLNWNNPTNQESNIGARAAVKVDIIAGTSSSHPAYARLPSPFLDF